MLRDGVKEAPDINALAAKGDRSVTVMLWNYHDDDLPGPDAAIDLGVEGLPEGRISVHHYRIDGLHSNSYETWKKMGSPQQPTAEQYRELERSGQLALYGSPVWAHTDRGRYTTRFQLPRQAVSLIEIRY
jgi:xylan 1,4-beta-xylosidase